MSSQTIPNPACSGGTTTEPRHVLLRPGSRVSRHSEGWLQVGIESPRAVLLPDQADVRSLLARLRVGCAVPQTSPEAELAWRRLCAADLIVDADAFFHRLPADPALRAARATAYADHGREAPARLARRERLTVSVDAGPDTDEVARLLRLGGARLAGKHPGAKGSPAPYVRLVVSRSELSRSRLDAAMQGDVPHLCVRRREGRVLIGPFVVPGVTACLRCLDALESEADPRRPLIIEQYAQAEESVLVPDPVDRARLQLALAWAVSDVIAYIDGDRPTTWSNVVTLDAARDFTPRGVPRHPLCGCSWSAG
jgi:bacteriocin biosynthesis cyclodehydratase domain-containing protein